MSGLDDLSQKNVYLVGGPGGVGKTTLAASLAIRLAEQGHRTMVLTVDPARRLAQALGFKDFTNEVQRVTLPDHPDAVLYASMLDTQRYFDKIIERFASSPEQRDKLLNHPLYRVTIDNLGGTHEYAAMERLLEFATDKNFDKVVVDTPPTQNAIDLLSAPQRLADFMDNSVLQWFQRGEKPFFRLFMSGTRLAMKVLQRLLGGEFFDSLSSFIDDLGGMQQGFQRRNLEVLELLRSPSTAFLLVSYPSQVRYLESVAFKQTLQENRISLSALILNRLEPEPPPPTGLEMLPAETREPLQQVLSFYQGLFVQEQHWAARFAAAFPNTPAVRIAKRGGALHDLATLSQIGEMLIK